MAIALLSRIARGSAAAGAAVAAGAVGGAAGGALLGEFVCRGSVAHPLSIRANPATRMARCETAELAIKAG